MKKIKEENKYYIGKCVDFTHDGQGVVKINNKTTFVPSLLIGEEAEIEILYRKKDFDVGKIHKLIKTSEYRITPLCKCATSCGGCVFQNLDYQKELEYKRDVATNILNKIGKFSFKNIQITGMDYPYYYRNKIQVPFGKDKQNRIVCGFYKFKSHDIVPINECVIEDKVHVNILKVLKDLLIDFKLEPYNEDSGVGLLRHCLIRTGKISKETMVVLVLTNKNFKGKNNFVKAFKERLPEVKTLVFNENPRKTNVILGNFESVEYGPGFIYDYLLGVKFKISSKSFYQINHDQCELLYSKAISFAELKKDDIILDAYCGIGTIGLIASKYVNKVYGVEIVKEAIVDAKENAKINNIKNINFECKDASDYTLNNNFDVIFVDPPRKGLDSTFINVLLSHSPNKIVYISCNVSTLARDLSILKDKYEINKIEFVDMFPRTYHVETVVSLRLKER